jgi:hypothetical protein
MSPAKPVFVASNAVTNTNAKLDASSLSMTFLQRTFFDAATLTAVGSDMKFQDYILVYW